MLLNVFRTARNNSILSYVAGATLSVICW